MVERSQIFYKRMYLCVYTAVNLRNHFLLCWSKNKLNHRFSCFSLSCSFFAKNIIIKDFNPILYVLHCPFNNAFFTLLYTKNEYDYVASKTDRLVVDTMCYHRLWKLLGILPIFIYNTR
jgi:hypothetical protein